MTSAAVCQRHVTLGLPADGRNVWLLGESPIKIGGFQLDVGGGDPDRCRAGPDRPGPPFTDLSTGYHSGRSVRIGADSRKSLAYQGLLQGERPENTPVETPVVCVDSGGSPVVS